MIKYLREKFYRLETAALDARATNELSRLGLNYLPWSRSAIRPAALANILNEVMVNRRTSVVELGSGISTVYLAKILSKSGGRLTSFDHDPEWLSLVRAMLDDNGLSDVVKLIAAPLTAMPHSPLGLPWYDTGALSAASEVATIDLLVVDGPIAHDEARQLARFPAFPFFCERLSPRSAVILDDANRKGEREVVRRWTELPQFNFSVRFNHCGLAILTRGDSFTSDL